MARGLDSMVTSSRERATASINHAVASQSCVQTVPFLLPATAISKGLTARGERSYHLTTIAA
eukprot:5807318-Amphidinium_carterae.1